MTVLGTQTRWLMRIGVRTIVVLALLVVVAGTAAAQEVPLDTYTTENGFLKFQYPQGWFVEETGVAEVYVGNTPSAMEQMGAQIPSFTSGDILVQVSVDFDFGTANVGGAPMELIASLRGTLAVFLGDVATIGEPEAVTIGPNNGARLTISSDRLDVELLFIALQTGNYISLVNAGTQLGEMSQFEDEILAIASSIQINSENDPISSLVTDLFLSGDNPTTEPTTETPGDQTPTQAPPAGISGDVDQALGYGDSVSGELNDSDGESWTFAGEEGDVVSIRLLADFDNYLELRDSLGNIVTEDDDSGDNLNAFIQSFVVPERGEYTIVARSYDASDTSATGPYTLELTQIFPLTPGPIQLGEIVNTVLTAEEEAWTFEGTSGDRVSILLVGGFDTMVELYGPDETLIASSDDTVSTNVSYVDNVTLPETGEYTVRVSGYQGDLGSYLLTVGRAKDADAN